MDPPQDVAILINPRITADQPYAFYERNNICEAEFSKDAAAKVLERSSQPGSRRVRRRRGGRKMGFMT